MHGLISPGCMLPITVQVSLCSFPFQDLNEGSGAQINAQSSFHPTALDNEDKVGKIIGNVVSLQLKCYNIQLHAYLSIYPTQLSLIEDTVVCPLDTPRKVPRED